MDFLLTIQQLAQIIQKPESNIMLNPYFFGADKFFLYSFIFVWFIYHFYIPCFVLQFVNKADIIELRIP